MFKKENRLTTIFIVVILFFIGIGIWGSFSNKSERTVASLPVSTNKVYDPSEQPLVGDENAPVEMMIFSDFQ
ncbi:hypothetical protein [Bacillus sp. B15-48]|uniref:hypothetical protein n=1 Tax=Bacillus sp. B15-48 TaxID=1548601 RepID=UPI00193F24E7|nr:hypothetical protein [Bacillus sp. B15-48]MBM4761033.1 hypothetical protein [Bacillus sp. B15-48]